jgi:predicted permease
MRRPPRLAMRILARALRRHAAAPSILGDLEEDFVHLIESRGLTVARLWYWREAIGIASGGIAHGLPRALRSVPFPGLRRLGEDAVHAARVIRRTPGFSLFTGVVIGLGVGAVTTVFSVLKPLAVALPFEDAHQLVWISNKSEAGDSALSAVTSRTTNLIDFRARTKSFSGITGYDAFFADRAYTLQGVGEPENLVGVAVAHDFLDVLGIAPLYGRGFTLEEGQPGGPAVVLLSHGFWRDRFGADPDIVGRTLSLNHAPRTVVGVLPRSFDFASVFSPSVDVDVLFPFVVSRNNPFQGNELALVGRLRTGVTPDVAQAELTALLAALRKEDPRRWGLGAELETLQEHLAGPFRRSLLLVAAAAGMLLLVVCVNVSGLMLARAPLRTREVAVRKALGARRGRLMRQLVMETLGISLVGAAFGSILAWFATSLVRNAASIHIPLMDSVDLDTSALLVAAGAAIVTGVLVGTIPALQVTEGGEAEVLRATSRGSSAGRGARRLRESLVVAEVALACALLVVGALLTTSLRAVLQVDLGFEPTNTVAWRLHPGTEFESFGEKSEFYAQLAERVEVVTGVESAGLIDALPLGRNRSWGFRVVGWPEQEDTDEQVFAHIVDPGYLPTMQTPIVAGRNLSRADHWGSARVIVLNETGARQIFGGEGEALGRRLKFWGPWEWEVVGVARDVRHLSPEMDAGIEVYYPLAQMRFNTADLVVRSRLPATQIAAAVSGALAEMDRAMPTREFWTLESTVRGAVSGRRFAVGVLSAFAAAALLLAALGIYGVLSQTVAERKQEIGIRMALGAAPPDIVRGVMNRMLLLTAGGIAAGWGISVSISRLLGSLLFDVAPLDPGSFLGTALVLLGVAALAAGLPARRAASTEASQVLQAQ